MNTQRYIGNIIILLLFSFLVSNCASSAPLFDTATPTLISPSAIASETPIATVPVFIPSDTPSPTLSPSNTPLTKI